MAQEIPYYEFRPGNSLYKWEEWMTGNPVKLTRGTKMEQMRLPPGHPDHADFIVDPESLRTAGYAWADRNGYKVTISVPDDNTVVICKTGRKRKLNGGKPYPGWRENPEIPRFGSDPHDINY